MAEPVSALAFSVAGALVYGIFGFLKQKQNFEPRYILTTTIAALLGAGVLLATNQAVTADNVLTVLLGNAGLAATADQALTIFLTRVLKRPPS